MIGGIVVPAVLGAVAGVLLGSTAGGYYALSAAAFLGAVLAGAEHRGAGEGAERGFAGGLVFGAFVLLAHAIDGSPAEADLGELPALLPLVAGLVSTAPGAFGGWLRARSG